MIATDTALLQSILRVESREHQSLGFIAAHRFGHYVRTQFDPQSPTSWSTADALYRSALLAIRGERQP